MSFFLTTYELQSGNSKLVFASGFGVGFGQWFSILLRRKPVGGFCAGFRPGFRNHVVGLSMSKQESTRSSNLVATKAR